MTSPAMGTSRHLFVGALDSTLPIVAAPSVTKGRSYCTQPHRRGQRIKVEALHIDRRGHLERAWKKQQEADAQEAAFQEDASVPTEVRTLHGLESVIEGAGSSIVVIFFYSRSCGACKVMLQHYRALCAEAATQRAGVRFLTHNVRDEFDDVTAIARLYRIKSVPCFSFFSGGALMRSMPMPDSRIDPSTIKKVVVKNSGRLNEALREMLFRDAPSARK